MCEGLEKWNEREKFNYILKNSKKIWKVGLNGITCIHQTKQKFPITFIGFSDITLKGCGISN